MATIRDILKTRQPAPSRKAWDRWDREQVREQGWWSALKLGGMDEAGAPLLAQWHWPHRMFPSWRIYPAPEQRGCLRQVGLARLHGCFAVGWWLSGCIVWFADRSARDVPATVFEIQAPAIHSASGDYAGGGRDGATAREWPDLPPDAAFVSYLNWLAAPRKRRLK